jgi:hypothetical protein
VKPLGCNWRYQGEGDFWWVPLAVLIGAIIAEAFSFPTAIIETNHVRGKQSWVSFVRNAKQPELPVILLEDLGALVGLIFALFAVSLTLLLRIRTAVPMARVIYLEPDVHRSDLPTGQAVVGGAPDPSRRDGPPGMTGR